jgi:hypothetical protein
MHIISEIPEIIRIRGSTGMTGYREALKKAGIADIV